MKTLVTLALAALFSMSIRAYVDVGVTTQFPQSDIAVSQNAGKIDAAALAGATPSERLSEPQIHTRKGFTARADLAGRVRRSRGFAGLAPAPL